MKEIQPLGLNTCESIDSGTSNLQKLKWNTLQETLDHDNDITEKTFWAIGNQHITAVLLDSLNIDQILLLSTSLLKPIIEIIILHLLKLHSQVVNSISKCYCEIVTIFERVVQILSAFVKAILKQFVAYSVITIEKCVQLLRI
ncbi:hypothetical protein PHYBLDRAFT_60362 [Phycomyces blakesleeanus NRRL 1555(-)]|uniref:Uncharacterized protein n=1 Tax=Phycomyces blakesleeanus (strain ATCC 8743b / DSM 1359 / FGSC 10004 / NBRC 33097 / NRRL 1555) TaxID=763407 RepID=A0A167LB63_PHYB8|nr:hypothetical protein PHYBLDRAFT_60362 [Phycomyces blakesleeanus NRRL 1555(-)]OAD70038.1 hypothetical protein PHYBLDRAFT_60362 [Phycomyces blakesleeanus NRRL 1555(-)]|eukprot:XP_018288078.1 hypothetical protein PHYBLDRAFT_60362 [Phycomyces blakesleeanus NRRL 1555(-)]